MICSYSCAVVSISFSAIEHSTIFGFDRRVSRLQAAHRVKHVDGEEEDEMPATNLSKLVCLKTEGEKVRRGLSAE